MNNAMNGKNGLYLYIYIKHMEWFGLSVHEFPVFQVFSLLQTGSLIVTMELNVELTNIFNL